MLKDKNKDSIKLIGQKLYGVDLDLTGKLGRWNTTDLSHQQLSFAGRAMKVLLSYTYLVEVVDLQNGINKS